MIFIECQQGSDEWRAARAGVITASRAGCILDVYTSKDKAGQYKQKAIDYADILAIERISGYPSDEGYNSWQMQRGTDEEPRGRKAYETLTGDLVQRAGVVLTDDRRFGYSTDGFVDDDGAIEIKSLVGARSVMAVHRDHDLSEYMAQMQFGLWLTGRKWIDFVLWCPQLEAVRKSLYVHRVERDENYISMLELALVRFERLVSQNERALRA